MYYCYSNGDMFWTRINGVYIWTKDTPKKFKDIFYRIDHSSYIIVTLILDE